MSGLRIERVRVEAFGQLSGVDLTLSPGLNLLCGPNEAGKSTLMAFLRWMLFGFDRKAQGDLYEPLDGRPVSGELTVATAGGTFLLRRRGRRTLEGDLSLRPLRPQDPPVAATALGDALGGLSRDLYCQVFAFGLDELASFEALASQGAVADALFAAGVQGGQRLPEALRTLRQRSEELFVVKGKTRPLNQLLSELEQARAQLAALGDRPARHAELTAKRGSLQQSLSQLDLRAEEARRALERWSRLWDAREDLLLLTAAEEEAQAERAVAPPEALSLFGEDAEARPEARLEAAVHAAREHEAAAVAQLEAEQALAREARPLSIAAVLEEAEAAVSAFAGVTPTYLGLPERLEELTRRRSVLEARVAALGVEGGVAGVLSLELTAAAMAQLGSLRDHADAVLVALREKRETCRAAAADRARLEEEHARLQLERSTLEGPTAAALREKQAALIATGALRGELQAIDAVIRDRTERCATLSAPAAPRPQRLVSPMAMALLGVGVAGAMAGLTVWLAADQRFAPLWPWAAGLGALLSVALCAVLVRASAIHRQALTVWNDAEQARAEARATVTAELERLRGQRTAVASALVKNLSVAGLGAEAASTAVALALESVADGLRQAEQRARVDAALSALSPRRAAADRDAGEAAAGVEALQAEHDRLRAAIDAWAVERSLPAGIAPDRLHELAREAVALQEQARELIRAEALLTADRARCDQVTAPILALTARLSIRCDEAAHAARELKAQIDAERARQARWAELQARAAAARLQADQRASTRDEAAGAVVALCTAHGVDGEPAFRQRAAAAFRWRTALARANRLRAAIEARTGRPAGEAAEAVRGAGGWSEVERQRDQAQAAVSSIDAERRTAAETLGAVRRELDELETAGDTQRLRAEEEALKLRIAALADRYAVERLALSLLETARRRYEEEHQPRLLQIASRVLRQLTRGRYVQLRTPDGGDGPALVAVGADGETWSPERLSRGTREQVYLAFRIAAVEDLGQARVRLPVILDDVLVNFDGPRAASAADAVVELSQRNQVLAFTCHPHLAALCTSRGAHALTLGTGPVQQELLRLPA